MRFNRFTAAAGALCVGALGLGGSVSFADAAARPVLSLGACEPTFYEDFKTLSVSPWGPGTRWIAHTPWSGDFGDAVFSDPEQDFPFRAGPQGLTIEARKVDGKWRSGLLSSTDAQGRGFAQTYGYFEIRTKLPPGPGTWPAFWLDTRQGAAIPIEIDVMEYYGAFTGSYQAAIHVWRNGVELRGATHQIPVEPGSLVSDFHTYGVSVERDVIVYYFDRREAWRVPTPREHREPLGILVNLALGSGHPIDKTPDPSQMLVSYIAVYPPLASCR